MYNLENIHDKCIKAREEWIQIVDLLDAKSLENVARIFMQLPADTRDNARRRLEYNREQEKSVKPLEGILAGDPQTCGIMFHKTPTKGRE